VDLHSPDREEVTSLGEKHRMVRMGKATPSWPAKLVVAKVELPFSGGGDSEQVDDGETNLQDLLIGVVFSAPANLQ
jgi:hypothetical protein